MNNNLKVNLKILLEQSDINWSEIERLFTTEPAVCEDLLFKIHLKRNRKLETLGRSNIMKFLSLGYSAFSDVRYFNEMLWFSNSEIGNRKILEQAKVRFFENLNLKGHHKSKYEWWANSIQKIVEDVDIKVPKKIIPLRVCLIGFPPFFGKIIKNLRKEGFTVDQYFLPFHQHSIIKKILKLGVLVKIWSILNWNFYSYKTLNYSPNDKGLGSLLKDGNYDIAFHKLNLIIRRNIFDSFRIGLLNDHWGFLPLLRGKSTIAFSILLDIPVIATVHLIAAGIDEGSIISYYPLNIDGCKSIDQVRKRMRSSMPERIIAAIKNAGTDCFSTIENRKEFGLTYFEIHPWLVKYISKNFLS